MGERMASAVEREPDARAKQRSVAEPLKKRQESLSGREFFICLDLNKSKLNYDGTLLGHVAACDSRI